MSNRIQILPTQLANQIAAGEVIERPASIVKELLENSLDAGATQIDITIEHGGIDLIRIQDNGHGIHPDDMALTVDQHATSKIQQAQDLEAIATLGFRGEALASISAVSRLTIISAQAGQDHAMMLSIEGRDEACIKPAAHPTGTVVQVEDLFFNTPARRKFLRSPRTEWQAIEEVIKRILLARFDVDITVHANGKRTGRYPAIFEKKRQHGRVGQIFSQAFIKQAHVVDACAAHYQLSGWCAPADFTRSSNDWQYFYVNGRMVKDKLIQHAMRQAFADSLYPGRYAAYVLYLQLDAAQVDVNVHPTKHEVRFQDPRSVHAFIVQSVRALLPHEPLVVPEQVAQAAFYRAQPGASDQAAAQAVYADLVTQTPPVAAQQHALGRVLTLLDNRLIISQTDEGLAVVNCSAYFAYQAYQVLEAEQTVRTQPLLTPKAFVCHEKQSACLAAQQPALQALGFEIDLVAENNWLLRQIPAVLARADLSELCRALTLPLNIKQLADLAIPEAGISLAMSDMQQILASAAALPSYARCPKGQKVSQLLTATQLSKNFPGA